MPGAQWVGLAMDVAHSFRLKPSKAALNRVAIGKSEAPLVLLRWSDTYLRGEARTPVLFLQQDSLEPEWD